MFRKNRIEQNKKEKSSFDFSELKSVDCQSVLSNQFNLQDLPVIGGIAVPDLKINLPIFKGVDNTSLLYGAVTIKEEEVMGKGTILIGIIIWQALLQTSLFYLSL